MPTLLSVLLFLGSALGPYSSASNFSVDIAGTPDSRFATWGSAGVITNQITFSPPPGYRVRVLRVYGDFLVWPHGKTPEGTAAGALWGLQSTAPEGSVHADLAADNTMLYVQVATSGKPERAPINFDVSEGGLLADDNVLVSKVAVWLNDTGLSIHCEPSFVVVYRFEKR